MSVCLCVDLSVSSCIFEFFGLLKATFAALCLVFRRLASIDDKDGNVSPSFDPLANYENDVAIQIWPALD